MTRFLICEDANWKDKLTSFDCKAITYDAIGNLLSYDGWTYTWEEGRRQLKSMTKTGNSLRFKYTSSGMRTEKSVNGVLTKYVYLSRKVALRPPEPRRTITTMTAMVHPSSDK